jgi:glycosyltransferase involved in cell wall biosynthesis
MKILIVSQYFHPEPMRIADITKTLVERGHDVRVLTGLPNYPEGIVPDEYKGKNYKKHEQEEIFGAKVYRAKLIGRGKSSLSLLLNYISFAVMGSVKARKIAPDADIVFIQQHSPITLCRPAYIYAKRAKCPVVLNCLDLWPESITSRMRLNPNGFFYKRLKNYCRKIYSKATALLVTSAGFADYFQEVLEMERDVIHIPQYAEDIFEASPLPKNKGLKLLFAGNVGKAQAVDTIIRAASLLRDRDEISWDIVGSGSALNECKDLANELSVSHLVNFHGRKPLKDMPKYYSEADSLIVTLKANKLIEYTLPGKVQTYMAAGRPILAAAGGETTRVIEDADCGLACASEDFISLAKNALNLLEDKSRLKGFAKNARDYYDKNYCAQKFFDDIENIMDICVKNYK